MKFLLKIYVFIAIGALSSAYIISKSVINGNDIQTIYSSINDFIDKNPDIKVIPMKAENSNNLNLSRSYSIGSRQIGKFFRIFFN